MSTSNSNTVEHNRCGPWSGKRASHREGRSVGNWSGTNIAAMVVGFVFFWPVGLVVLFWILSGRQVQDLPGAVRQQWRSFFGNGREPVVAVDNMVFNEYQQTQYDRIREIKEEIKGRAQRFSDFRMNAKRRADQEEFDQFMASNPSSGASGQSDQSDR